MTKVLVKPGICGFNAIIEVISSGSAVKLKIESDCDDIQKLAQTLTVVSTQDLMNITSFTENPVYKNAAEYIRHFSCPIPCAIMKAIEAELGFALKENVIIEFIKES